MRVQPEASGVTIDLALPDYKIEDVVRDGVTYQQIVVDSDGWAQAGLAGAPRLPERGLMVAVPPTGDVTLEIIDAAPLTAAGSYRLDPAPFVTLEEDRLVETWQPSPDKYAEAAWTPAAQAEIAQQGWLRGYRFVRLSLRPFQYNPASGEIRVASTLRVRLAFSEPGPSVRSLTVDSIYARGYWSPFAHYDHAKDGQTRPVSAAGGPVQAGSASEDQVTGATEGLAYVSPKSGRAVTAKGAGDWADRLLPLPEGLGGNGPLTAAAVLTGLRLTGFFLDRELRPVLHDRPLPEARARLVDLLSRPA